MKKLLALLLVASMLMLSLTGCSSEETTTAAATEDQSEEGKETTKAAETQEASTEPAAPAKDEVTVWNNNMIDNFNPVEWYNTVQTPLFSSVYSTLIRIVYDESGNASYIGDLADSWETEQDGAVWVFHLNPNAKFTNGEPVTADDVKFSFEQVQASAYTSYKLPQVKSIEVKDEHTVAINVGAFSAQLPWSFADVAIVEADAFQADLESYMAQQIGSGPYKLDSIEAETGNFVLVRNEDYYGTPANIGKVNVKVITDASNAVIALQSGELDYMYLSGMNYTLVKDDPNVETKEQPSGYGTWLMLNSSNEMMSNKYLRQAIGYAINYEAQYNLGLGGYPSALNPTTPYSAPADPVGESVNTYHYDPDKAKELIAQSGLTTPIDLGEIYGGGGGKAELVQQNLADVGIIVQPVSLESYAMVEAYIKGNYVIGIMGGIGGGSMTAAASLANNYGTGGANNLEHFSNPEVDALIAELDKIDKAVDEAGYNAKVQQILEIVVDEAPVFNMGTGSYFSAYVPGLQVPTCNTGLVYLADLAWK